MALTGRRSLKETWEVLENRGEKMPRDSLGRPFVPPRMPSYDDEAPLGFSFFRSRVEDADFSNSLLPRTFFGRSLLERVSFRNTDLSESRMCWNDFNKCDFSDADLSRCDMRASIFKECKFNRATLERADLRHSSFKDCDFTDAKLNGAIGEERNDDLHHSLNKEQEGSMERHAEPGPEPTGG